MDVGTCRNSENILDLKGAPFQACRTVRLTLSHALSDSTSVRQPQTVLAQRCTVAVKLIRSDLASNHAIIEEVVSRPKCRIFQASVVPL